MNATSVAPGRTRTTGTSYRVGLVLAALLGVLDIVGGLSQLGPDALLPFEVAATVTGLGIVTVALVPFAWRGSGWASWTIIVLRALSALTTLPAFFVTGVPTIAVITAAVTIAVTIALTVLAIVRTRVTEPALNP